MACVWLALGMQEDCSEQTDSNVVCIKSWVYNYGFDLKPYYSRYIFAFYWIFDIVLKDIVLKDLKDLKFLKLI